MGIKLCGLRQSTDRHPPNDPKTGPGLSRLALFTFPCLKADKKREVCVDVQEEKPVKLKKLTLEECLLASPALARGAGRRGEAQAWRQSSKLCPWIPRSGSVKVHARSPAPRNPPENETLSNHFSQARDSVCVERERRLGNGQLVSSLRRSQSGNGKRVSFRLPEEADIFYVFQSEGEQDRSVSS